MKRNFFRLTMLGVTLALGLAWLQAQDLSQLAKKTRAERMQIKKQHSVRVWTNDNMPKAPASSGPTAAGGMSPAAPPPPSTPSYVTQRPPAPSSAADSEAAELDSMQDQIKQGEQSIKGLEERLRLSEDELSLLQIQQANELAPSVQADVAAKIKAKNAEIAGERQALEKAQKDLEAAKKEFKARGGTLEEKK